MTVPDLRLAYVSSEEAETLNPSDGADGHGEGTAESADGADGQQPENPESSVDDQEAQAIETLTGTAGYEVRRCLVPPGKKIPSRSKVNRQQKKTEKNIKHHFVEGHVDDEEFFKNLHAATRYGSRIADVLPSLITEEVIRHAPAFDRLVREAMATAGKDRAEGSAGAGDLESLKKRTRDLEKESEDRGQTISRLKKSGAMLLGNRLLESNKLDFLVVCWILAGKRQVWLEHWMAARESRKSKVGGSNG